jgi:hypothetical protein
MRVWRESLLVEVKLFEGKIEEINFIGLWQ